MYLPKSMMKKLGPNISLDFNLDKIIDKLLDKAFGVIDDAIGLNTGPNSDPKKSGVPGVTLSTRDVQVFQTRNLEVLAMTKEDMDKGNFDKAVFVSKEVPVEKDLEPVITRFRPNPLLSDYQLGTIDRYVLFDIRNKGIIEVSEADYVEFRSLRYKRSFVLSWYIFGKADDYQIDKYIYPGVRNNNIDVLVQAQTLIPGISEYFEDKTEYLLEDLNDYSGGPEVVNLPEPEDPIPEEKVKEIEDLGFGPDTLDLPELPKIDLDFAEDLAGDFSAADELLGNISSSIDDLLATQDQVTAEQENLLGEQERRIREIEEKQKAENRKQAFLDIINDQSTPEGKQAHSITVMSSGAKRKKKKRRLDQRYDVDNAGRLFSSIFNKNKWKDDKGVIYDWTPKEVKEWCNESKLKIRMKLYLTSSQLYTKWTRDNKNYSGKTVLHRITAADGSSSEEIPDPYYNYNTIKLTLAERRMISTLLRGRDRRNAELRGIIQKIWKEQKQIFRDKVGRDPIGPAEIRNQVQDRYNEWKRLKSSNQTGRYSKRGRDRNRNTNAAPTYNRNSRNKRRYRG
jgi:hypothetical protein